MVCLVLSVVSILGAGTLIWRTRAVGSGSAISLAITIPLANATFLHASKIVYPLGFYLQKGSY
ncbi:MAG: hypothetical protein DRI56_12790 [Chloroflexota bacterium]|nr:MAG: hypothetical protein DRI56_12790 [Chloroflexota bacterium]